MCILHSVHVHSYVRVLAITISYVYILCLVLFVLSLSDGKTYDLNSIPKVSHNILIYTSSNILLCDRYFYKKISL